MIITEAQILVTLEKAIFDTNLERLGEEDIYDVDMFIQDVMHYPWKDLYEFDDETLVNFNCALMLFCRRNDYFKIAELVILFSELSYWAQRYWVKEPR